MGRIADRPPHVVIADIRLGTSDGYALIKAIRELNFEYEGFMPAVAVTGYASPEEEERALAGEIACQSDTMWSSTTTLMVLVVRQNVFRLMIGSARLLNDRE
jgi:CheY-like chemotaxis protein